MTVTIAAAVLKFDRRNIAVDCGYLSLCFMGLFGFPFWTPQSDFYWVIGCAVNWVDYLMNCHCK